MRFVWAVSVKGGEPADIRAAIDTAIKALISGVAQEDPSTLSRDELEPWVFAVNTVSVSEVACSHDTRSVLVDVDIFDDHDGLRTAAVLSGAFDEIVLGCVMKVPGVTEASHSDRIQRLN